MLPPSSCLPLALALVKAPSFFIFVIISHPYFHIFASLLVTLSLAHAFHFVLLVSISGQVESCSTRCPLHVFLSILSNSLVTLGTPFAVIKLCLSIQQLMEHPNPDDPLDSKVAEVYKTNPEFAKQQAAEWTEKYAKS